MIPKLEYRDMHFTAVMQVKKKLYYDVFCNRLYTYCDMYSYHEYEES